MKYLPVKRMAPALAGALCLCLFAAKADTPADNQVRFAENLARNGDDAFSLLEYKRFVFLYPEDPRVPDALLAIAALTVPFDGNVAGACRILAGIAERYPDTETARKSLALKDFFEVNSDFDAKPLLLWLTADSRLKRNDAAGAVTACDAILAEFPTARLADDAALRKALIVRDTQADPAAAEALLADFATRFPGSELTPKATCERARCLARIPGREKEAADALRAFAAAYPDDPAAADALAEAAELQKKIFVVERRYERAFVREFSVEKERQGEGIYTIDIEVPVAASVREVRATLEEALITRSDARAKPEDVVTVTAYFNHPFTVAGSVTWTPGTEPAYSVGEQQTEDVIKDVFIDILRRR